MAEVFYLVTHKLADLVPGEHYPASRIRLAIIEHVRQRARQSYQSAAITGVILAAVTFLLYSLFTNETAPSIIATGAGVVMFLCWLTYSFYLRARGVLTMSPEAVLKILLASGDIVHTDMSERFAAEFDVIGSMIASGATKDQIVREYVSRLVVGEDTAQQLFDYALSLYNMREALEGDKVLKQIDTALGISSKSDDGWLTANDIRYRLPPELHRARCLDRRDRRALHFLARRVSHRLAQNGSPEQVRLAIESLGVSSARAEEFVSLVTNGLRCIKAGADFSRMSNSVRLQSQEESRVLLSGEQAMNVVRADPRPYSIYLRSYSEDRLHVQRSGLMYRLLGGKKPLTFEEVILPIFYMNTGPIFTFRGPNEDYQCIIPRLNIDEENWQEVVTYLLMNADTVLLRFCDTPGLTWETREALAVVRAERLVLAFPDVSSLPGRHAEWHRITSPLLKHADGLLDVEACRIAMRDCPLILRLAADGTPMSYDSRTVLGSYFRIQRALASALKDANSRLGSDDIVLT